MALLTRRGSKGLSESHDLIAECGGHSRLLIFRLLIPPPMYAIFTQQSAHPLVTLHIQEGLINQMCALRDRYVGGLVKQLSHRRQQVDGMKRP
jgi:hypothetical protein